MPPIERIQIFYEKFEVGSLKLYEDGDVSFTYHPMWTATKASFPLSVTLPLGLEVFGSDKILPWLANLLPEEEQLTALSRAMGLSSSDTLAILRQIGGDTAGAISIGEPSHRPAWAYTSLQEQYQVKSEEEALEAHFGDLAERPFLAGEDGVRLSLAGGQKKSALAVLDAEGNPKLGLIEPGDRLAVPKNGAPSTIIVKPDNPTLLGIVENESYCLTLAKMIGIDAVDCQILKSSNRTALAVPRYDRLQRKDASVRRLHQEDFAQANGIYPGRKYEAGTIPGLSLQDILGTARHLPARDALNLLDQVIFNILVANTDAHAKNYSITFGENVGLAPLYDVSSVLRWDHINQNHAQLIAGKKRKPVTVSGRHWDAIAEENGLNARNLRKRVQELVDLMVKYRVSATQAVASQSGATARIVEDIAELIEINALRIAGRLREAQ
jgi:serine/threonine-protein kinase HipA